MVRDHPDGEQMRKDLETIMVIGELSFKSGKLILMYITSDWSKLEAPFTRLGIMFNSKPDYFKWKWIGQFFNEKLHLQGTYRTYKDRDNIYEYTLEFNDTLWNHIL